MGYMKIDVTWVILNGLYEDRCNLGYIEQVI